METATIEEVKNRLKDENIVVSFFCGEAGWAINNFQGWLRYLKHEKYPNHKFIVFMDMPLSALVQDYAYMMLPLPDFCYLPNLDRDSYELVEKDSIPGSLTSPKLYSDLIKYIRQYYDITSGKVIELFAPRGCNHILDSMPQVFSMYGSDLKINSKKPIISVFPRNRERGSSRNVPINVWKEVVDKLKEDFLVVLGGTPNGACLSDYPESKDVINLIGYTGDDKLEKIIAYLNHSMCSIGSQSFLTTVSMLSNCPTYIIGHEKERNCQSYNRFNLPTSFRYVYDYRAIDSDTIIEDVARFLYELEKVDYFKRKATDPINRPSLRSLKEKKELVGAEIGVSDGGNALNILENLDIKKLYLLDPYINYEHFTDVAIWKQEAYQKLEKYKDKIVWIEKKSDDAINDIPDNLDFAYIDGGHQYNEIKNDIINYYPKIKDGGLISFHDFELDSVRVAILETIKEIVYSDSCIDCEPLEAWCFKGQTKENMNEEVLIESNQILQELMK